MKRPAFQFYPGDWRRDTALRACSIGARGLWVELLCIMHDGEPYGHLAIRGEAIPDRRAAGMVGLSPASYRRHLAELESLGVCSRTEGGIVFSRRMVRDDQTRQAQVLGGAASTRPDTATKRAGQGVVSRLFNFLLLKHRGCLHCGAARALELHRVIPGRKGGKYEPGNVLLLCHDCHALATFGELPAETVLAKSGHTLTGLFEGYREGIGEGMAEGIGANTPGIPPAVAVAVASASARTTTAATARVRESLPELYRPAFDGYLRSARNPTAFVAELEAMESGMHPPRHTWETLGHALHDMAVAGVPSCAPRALHRFALDLEAGPATATPRIRPFASAVQDTPGTRWDAVRAAARAQEGAR